MTGLCAVAKIRAEMPFLRALIRQAVRQAANDPRVRETAKQVFENEVKPRAKDAWKKAQPEVAVAKEKALQGAARLASRIKKEIDERKSG